MAGTIQTTPVTSIDLHGYSGINKVTVDSVGGKYAISFDKEASWTSKVLSGQATSTVGTAIANYSIEAATNGNFPSCYLLYDASYGQSTMYFNLPDFNTPTTIGAYELKFNGVYNSSKGTYISNGLGDFPTKHNFEGSNDKVTWTILDTRNTPADQWSLTVSKKFDIQVASQGAYKYYRVNVLKTDNYNSYIHANVIFSTGIAPLVYYPVLPLYTWQSVLESEIPVKGMTPILLNSLTSADYASVFTQTQLDIFAALGTGETLTSIKVDLPPNSAPAISNFKASTTTTHNTDIVLTANLADLEGDSIQYQLKIDGVVYSDWSALAPSPLDINVTVPFSAFSINEGSATHQIDLLARDARGATSTAVPVLVGRINKIPILTILTVDSRVLRATIGDADNDKIKYRILLNDVEVVPFTQYMASPATVEYYMDRSVLIWSPYPAQNKVTLEYQDDAGQGGKQDAFFLASYMGLIFTDGNGAMLNDDKGNILLRPNLGLSTSGTHGDITLIKLKNQTGLPLRNLNISTDLSTIPTDTNVKLSTSESVFEDLDNISSATLLNDGESLSFYVQPSSNANAKSGSTIKINATGQLV